MIYLRDLRPHMSGRVDVYPTIDAAMDAVHARWQYPQHVCRQQVLCIVHEGRVVARLTGGTPQEIDSLLAHDDADRAHEIDDDEDPDDARRDALAERART